MCRLTQIISWSKLHVVTIIARYILGKDNVLADQLSCPVQLLPIERLCLLWFYMVSSRSTAIPMSLFAPKVNTKLPIYIHPFQILWHGKRTLSGTAGLA